MSLIGKELGELLVDNGLLTTEQLEQVQAEKLKTGEPLRIILERLRIATENQLKNTLELQYGVTYVSLYKTEIDLDVVDSVPSTVVIQHRAIPISRDERRVTVAMVNPEDQAALKALKDILHLDIKPLVCMEDDFERFLDAIKEKRLEQNMAPDATSVHENGHELKPPATAEPPRREPVPPPSMHDPGMTGEIPIPFEYLRRADAFYEPLTITPDEEAGNAPPAKDESQPGAQPTEQPTQSTGLGGSRLGSRAHQSPSSFKNYFKNKFKGGDAAPEGEAEAPKPAPEPPPPAKPKMDPLAPSWLSQLSASRGDESALPVQPMPPVPDPSPPPVRPALEEPPPLPPLPEPPPATPPEVLPSEPVHVPETESSAPPVTEAQAPAAVETLMTQLASSAAGNESGVIAPYTTPSPETPAAVEEAPAVGITAQVTFQEAEAPAVPATEPEMTPAPEPEMTPAPEPPAVADAPPFAGEDQLLSLGLVSQDQLAQVRVEKDKSKDFISTVLTRLGIAQEQDISDALDMEYGVDFVPLSRVTIDSAALELLPEKVIRERRALPIQKQDNRVVLAMVNPDDLMAENDIKFRLKGMDLKKVVCLHGDFEHFMETTYALRLNGSGAAPPQVTERPPQVVEPVKMPPPQDASLRPQSAPTAEFSIPNLPPPVGVQPVQFPPPPPPQAAPEPQAEEPAPAEPPPAPSDEVLEAAHDTDDDVNFVDMAMEALDTTLLSLAHEMLLTAASKGYTHIHVEPQTDDLELRYWIESSLIESSRLEKNIHLELVRCFKSIAGIDLHASEKPQDKRIQMSLAGNDLDIRVTTIPSDFGEMVAVSIKFPDDER